MQKSTADHLSSLTDPPLIAPMVQVAATCTAFHAAVQQLTQMQGFQPRLVVACSGSHSLKEVDVVTGDCDGKNWCMQLFEFRYTVEG